MNGWFVWQMSVNKPVPRILWDSDNIEAQVKLVQRRKRSNQPEPWRASLMGPAFCHGFFWYVFCPSNNSFNTGNYRPYCLWMIICSYIYILYIYVYIYIYTENKLGWLLWGRQDKYIPVPYISIYPYMFCLDSHMFAFSTGNLLRGSRRSEKDLALPNLR